MFEGFDIFMVLFTILLFAALFGLVKQPKKNRFALGFGTLSLIVFLFMDVIMVANWMGIELKLPTF